MVRVWPWWSYCLGGRGRGIGIVSDGTVERWRAREERVAGGAVVERGELEVMATSPGMGREAIEERRAASPSVGREAIEERRSEQLIPRRLGVVKAIPVNKTVGFWSVGQNDCLGGMSIIRRLTIVSLLRFGVNGEFFRLLHEGR